MEKKAAAGETSVNNEEKIHRKIKDREVGVEKDLMRKIRKMKMTVTDSGFPVILNRDKDI